MTTLIEKAQAFQPGHKSKLNHLSPEVVALCVSWARGEIALIQAAHALDRKIGTGLYSFLARGLRHAVQTGVLVQPERIFAATEPSHANWREGDRSEDCPF